MKDSQTKISPWDGKRKGKGHVGLDRECIEVRIQKYPKLPFYDITERNLEVKSLLL